MTIDASIGGASSDSFTSLADANTYMGARLYTTEWDTASDTNKEKALKQATVELDRMNWKGDVVDTATPQALRWPRSSVKDLDGNTFASTIIPTFLKQATTELAASLLQRDRYKESDSTGIRKVSAGAVAVSFDRKDTNPRNPITVTQMISPFLNAGGAGPYTLLERA